jgi:hypothetical protein
LGRAWFRRSKQLSFLEVKNVQHEVADDVHYAVNFIQANYGAKQGYPTGHAKAPRVTYDFPKHGHAQVFIPFNQRDFSIYLRATTPDGRQMTEFLPAGSVLSTYPDDGNAGRSLEAGDIPYLKPSPTNRVLRLRLPRDKLKDVLDEYLGIRPVQVPAEVAPGPAASAAAPEKKAALAVPRREMSAEDLQDQLDRNSATGRAGEVVAVAYEMQRLANLNCPDPARYVRALFDDDVGRGYDIASNWPGEERCIEVKSTTRIGSDIYLSENERQVLKALAGKAWLYRVLVTPEGGRVVGEPLRDPIASLEMAGMSVAVWRAADPSTSTMSRAQ